MSFYVSDASEVIKTFVLGIKYDKNIDLILFKDLLQFSFAGNANPLYKYNLKQMYLIEEINGQKGIQNNK